MQSLQETAMGGGPATAKTANYVLVAADAGTTVAMDAAGATTITVNTGLFAAGDTVFIQNLGAGACTVTAGTATVATAGSLILPQNDAGILYFTSASAAIFYDYIQVGATSPLTTKGDLYTFGTSDTRLGVGTDGHTLVANSSTSTGLEWAAPASGGGMTLIQETVASGNTSISFSGIAGTYKQLLLTFHGLYFSNNTTAFSLRYNNSSVSEYSYQSWGFNQFNPTAQFISATATSAGMPTGVFGEAATSTNPYETVTGQILIDNYASTTKHKMYYGTRAYLFTIGGTEKQGHSVVGSWGNTSAITSLDIFRTQGAGTLSNIANTSIRLYGIS
jgi:hypothetical protein